MSHPIKYPLARLSPAKRELTVLQFSREYVDAGDIEKALAMLRPLVESRESAERFEGRVTFFFAGWDEDPRETAAIAEIRRWFQKLTGEFPYWFHLVEKEGDTLFHVLRLLCKGHCESVNNGLIGWRFDDTAEISARLMALFDHHNSLYERLGLPEEMNERISQEIAQLIDCSLE